MPAGAVRLVSHMRNAGRKTSYGAAYHIMKTGGIPGRSPVRPGRRKWVRYGRRYSNAMWHTNWHIMKDSRLKGLNLIAFLDDASRCITGFGVFEHATSENSVLALRKSIAALGTPAQIPSDDGSCFTSARRGTPGGSWTPTAFENGLPERNIVLPDSRPHHPQTNGKLERWFRTLGEELAYFDRISGFVEFYNGRRTHYSLDMKNGETPRDAFQDRKAPAAIRKNNPNWMEEDKNGGRK